MDSFDQIPFVIVPITLIGMTVVGLCDSVRQW